MGRSSCLASKFRGKFARIKTHAASNVKHIQDDPSRLEIKTNSRFVKSLSAHPEKAGG